jgi:hypothetical protein
VSSSWSRLTSRPIGLHVDILSCTESTVALGPTINSQEPSVRTRVATAPSSPCSMPCGNGSPLPNPKYPELGSRSNALVSARRCSKYSVEAIRMDKIDRTLHRSGDREECFLGVVTNLQPTPTCCDLTRPRKVACHLCARSRAARTCPSPSWVVPEDARPRRPSPHRFDRTRVGTCAHTTYYASAAPRRHLIL